MKEISVTKPFMPPIEEYQSMVQAIWSREWLTNDGPVLKDFESKMMEVIDTRNFLFVSNGTVALQIAIESLGITGSVLTTPFSYIATSTSILWQKCKPVFVDIDPRTFNVDADLIKGAISDEIGGMLFTHVFGNPCEVDRIEAIANAHGIPVIYDAAHAFGTRINGKEVMLRGDISCTSFHATKLFHTVEGGGVVSGNTQIHEKLALMRNFGHNGFYKFEGIGINGKNSEFHAAMGICNLKYLQEILKDRKRIYNTYKSFLTEGKCQFQQIGKGVDHNASYFPIVLKSWEQAEAVISTLREQEISPRRYFYPSLNTLYDSSQLCPVSEDIAARILCLPVYFGLEDEDIKRICSLVNGVI
ncbi:MAG: DegT/DnrJ/EryC1/StrS family aminotransferase [Vicingaceae bacterium]